MSVKDALEAFGQRVQQQAKANLSKKDKKDTGKLYESVNYDIKVHKRSFSFTFNLTDYALYVDEGVKGKASSAKAPNSRFKFGSGTGPKGGLTAAIQGWTQRKRIQFRDRATGRFMNYKQTAWIITKSIYSTGLKPTEFFSKPFENEFKKLPDELVKAYGLEVNKLMKFTLNK